MKKLIGFILLLLLLAGCSDAQSERRPDGKLEVVATIAQIADIAERVGGDHVDVKNLMGPGTDPHLYKPVSSDIQAMEQADIIFFNGLYLEGQMTEIFQKMSERKPAFAVAEAIPEERLTADPASPDIYDPHVWFDIELWKFAVGSVTEGLSEIDPAHADEFESNAAAYTKELDELHAYALERIATIPEKSRVLVTAHDAFQYFGKAYGMDVVGLQGLSTEAEYGLNDVERTINTIADHDVKAVFIESSVSGKSINAVIEGAASKGHDVQIGGELHSDAMGPKDSEEGTYTGMFRHNIDTIVDALN